VKTKHANTDTITNAALVTTPAEPVREAPLGGGFRAAADVRNDGVRVRSVVVALTSILLNLLSAAGAFGVLVGVFQYQWAEKILDFHSTSAV
jgi:hypothetical protein